MSVSSSAAGIASHSPTTPITSGSSKKLGTRNSTPRSSVRSVDAAALAML